MLTKIISGGQTGVDRAALDVALERGLACGGWCPRGRRAEDGRLPAHYPLRETPSWIYPQRTEWNVRDADATLVLTQGPPRGGTGLTIGLAARLGKPCLFVDLGTPPSISSIVQWVTANRVHVLNVAGPRASECPGIYDQAVELLRELLAADKDPDSS
jgi:hypothetical protein